MSVKQQGSWLSQFETRDLVLLALFALLCLGGGWWWSQNMERVWQANVSPKEAYRKQPMLAAKLLATQRGYQVTELDYLSLEAMQKIGKGTLIINDNDGVMSDALGDALLEWVEQGNTLITFPQLRYEKLDKEVELILKATQKRLEKDRLTHQTTPYFTAGERYTDANMLDPVGDYLGLQTIDPNRLSLDKKPAKPPASAPQAPSQLHSQPSDDPVYEDQDSDEDAGGPAPPGEIAEMVPTKETANVASTISQQAPIALTPYQSYVQLPHTGRGLVITRPRMRMENFEHNIAPLYQIDQGRSFRLYAHGKGKIAVMPQNIFQHHVLGLNDNAQFLLDLLSMNQPGKHFIIVQNLKATHWPELLWFYFPYLVLTCLMLIALWTWRSALRFGSLLPEVSTERRALIEHIEASARWAWTTANGRQNLLDASRAACKEALRRRAPELLRLNSSEFIEQVSSQCGIDATALANAWLDAAATNPISFTKQIQLLQRLRAHYER